MKNVIIISHSLIPSVILCGHVQLEYLKKQEIIDYKFVMAAKINTADLSWADIIVFVRSESDIEAYASELTKGKKHLVYVLDDDLLNPPDYVSSAKYYKIPSIHNNILKIMKNCDTFLTPSPVLLKKYGSNCKNAFLIDEPSLNVVTEKKKNNKVKIGFAGSIDRAQDINEIIEDSLKEIIQKYDDSIEIEFMGAKPNIVNEYYLKYIPYQDGYKKYTEVVGELNWDIGLAPMPLSPFHECKYFNKYVEYASFGIVGIYTNCKPYIFGIKDKENGLLVNNNKNEWVDALSLLIDNEKLREQISKKCLREANDVYSLEVLSKQFINNITYDYTDKERENIKGLWKYKVKCFFSRVVYKIKEQKWNLPFWMINKLWRIITGTNNKNNTLVNLTDVTKGL